VTARYDTRGYVHRGTVTIAAIRIWPRRRPFVQLLEAELHLSAGEVIVRSGLRTPGAFAQNIVKPWACPWAPAEVTRRGGAPSSRRPPNNS
jgi:hypothetical protein